MDSYTLSKRNVKLCLRSSKKIRCQEEPALPLKPVIRQLWGCKLRKISSLIRSKFGSADNTAALNESDETQGDEGVLPAGTKTLGPGQLQSSVMYGSDDNTTGGPASSRDNTPEHTWATDIDAALHELLEIRETQGQLEKRFQNLRDNYLQKCRVISAALQEEQCRGDILEQQLSDLTELCGHGFLNLKEELADLEEKIADQCDETATDFYEELEACQTHLLKLEQQQQQKQVVQPEGLANVTAQTLLGKLISVLLAVMTVFLVFVSTAGNCVVPFMNTPGRMLSTLLFAVSVSVLCRHWEVVSEYRHVLFNILRRETINKTD